MTEITSVACNHCGAPLQVQLDTRFVTCTYCGARLEVHRSGSSLYTQVLEAIEQRTQQMASDLDVIKRQNEVERLDREWMLRRDGYMNRDKRGRVSEPSIGGSVAGGLIAAVFGIIWTCIAASSGAPAFFPLFGVIFVIVGLVGAIMGASNAMQYQDAQRSYEQQRETMMRDDRGQR